MKNKEEVPVYLTAPLSFFLRHNHNKNSPSNTADFIKVFLLISVWWLRLYHSKNYKQSAMLCLAEHPLSERYI